MLSLVSTQIGAEEMTDLFTQPEADSRIEEDKGHSSFARSNKDTYVFVLCKCGEPLMPTIAPKARILLKQGKAKVYRLCPFTIMLTYETGHNTQPIQIRIDCGAKIHGVALVQRCKTHDRAVFLGEARQRQDIKRKMDMRKELRDRRRERKTRYRKPRYNNRRRREGWLPPTIAQRVESITRTTKALKKMTPITSAVAEIGMFDTQRITNPQIAGDEYQRGPSKLWLQKQETSHASVLQIQVPILRKNQTDNDRGPRHAQSKRRHRRMEQPDLRLQDM
jgi:hypothetical protein